MTSLQSYNKSEWLSAPSYQSNIIDTFFTQRKVTETEEYIDQKTLERKQKKINKTYNFLALNFPVRNHNNLVIDIEIWGDNNYSYNGSVIVKNGNIPNLMLKLNNDTQMFIKLIYKNNENNEIYHTFIDFIQISKRYQNDVNE
jgi:hypothetical protein